jgi:hypothetical protein
VIPPLPELGTWSRPLPDAVAVAIRRIRVPDSAPPYDPYDDADPDDQPQPAGLAEWVAAAQADQQPDQAEEPPDPGEWPGRFAQVLAETLAGTRPPQQVRPWTTEEARRRIRQLGPMLQAEQRPRVRRVLTSVPRPGVVEMTVVVGLGQRVRALAVRLEHAEPPSGQADRWVCTAIEAA